MCGILAVLSLQPALSCLVEHLPSEISNVIPYLARRGPDHQAWLAPSGTQPGLLWMYSAVLHLRGLERCDQPLLLEAENVLCWNGEVFGGEVPVREDQSDTAVMLLSLNEACSISDSSKPCESPVIEVLNRIEGPFAFIFWESRMRRLWFGRDRLGRRSLTIRRPSDESPFFGISSCVGEHNNSGWEEVEPSAIHCLSVSEERSTGLVSLEEDLIPWPARNPPLHRTFASSAESTAADDAAASDAHPALVTGTESRDLERPQPWPGSSRAEQLLRVLDESVRVRVQGVHCRGGEAGDASVGVMFSGGLDSTLLAALADRHVAAGEPIDLINVCFDPKEAPDRYTGVESLRELRRLSPGRAWRLVAVDVSEEMVEEARSRVLGLTFPCTTQMDFNIGTALWFGARGEGRVYDRPEDDTGEVLRGEMSKMEEEEGGGAGGAGREAKEERGGESAEGRGVDGGAEREEGKEEVAGHANTQAREGAGEGGGVNQVVEGGGEAGGGDDGGREGAEYKPLRTEVAAEVEAVHREAPLLGVKGVLEQVRERQPGWVIGEGRIKPILSRLKKAAAAHAGGGGRGAGPGASAAGEGFVSGTASDPRQRQGGRREGPIAEVLGEGRGYGSRARVLLLGMGADEQLCGYSRYRTKLLRAGEEGVLREMAMDMGRIWQRNLGRDDRCLADHGREARFPFLDEQVVALLARLPLQELADLSLPPGRGDKRLLREVGALAGLAGAAGEVKRAIQFGTRIAKQSNRRTFGSNRKGSGQAPLALPSN